MKTVVQRRRGRVTLRSRAGRRAQQDEIRAILRGRDTQAMLTVGEPDDEYEQEADRIAERVAGRRDTGASAQRGPGGDEREEPRGNPAVDRGTPPAQKQEQPREQEDEEVQAKAQDRNGAAAAMANAATSAVGSGDPGSPLRPDVRQRLESGIGADFGRVRVHENARSQEAARAIDARAFTHKNDIWLGAGESQDDIHLMAHEATHAVQQGAAATTSDLGRNLARRIVRRSSALRANAGSAVIQRRRSHGVSVSHMRFTPRSIKDDGVTTTQARVRYSNRNMAGQAALDWTLEGVAHGATIDAASGLITPGTDTVAADADKVRLRVKATDSVQAGAHTSASLWMWNRKVVQAKQDIATLRGLSPTLDPFQARSVGPANAGKFDATYNIRRRRLTAQVRIKYNFVNDGARPWRRRSRRRYINGMIRRVNAVWSGQWQFNVIREPKRVWQTLGPVSVRVRARQDNAAPHFVMDVHKAPLVTSSVNQWTQKGKIDADDARLQHNPFPGTRAAELAALRAKIPTPILFDPAAATLKTPADQNRLEFLARYLRAIRNPSFNLNITGHSQRDAAPATPRARRAAARAATVLSRQRARMVLGVLRSRDLSAHRIRVNWRGSRGAASTAAWDKVQIASSVSRRYLNRYNIQSHEFGHMLGLRDEYVSGGRAVGDKTQHYGLVKDALGQDYADAFARVQADSEGIMNGGRDVRPHHYVTFWQAIAQLTAAQAKPVPALGEADWKIVGV